MNTHRPRVLIFVVAYEAESTLQRVLDRIPRPMFERFDAEVLVIDDSSSDRTFEVGVRSAGASSHPITVFYNRTNQGYGGNQKLGYQYAIRNGFDFVVLLHGDGQYAPERIPDLLQPLVEGEADAVFGSRMLTRGAARQGGMPLYKFIGNKILTRLQNAPAAVASLGVPLRIPGLPCLDAGPDAVSSTTPTTSISTPRSSFSSCSRGVASSRCSIPTYYGDEICRVNGMLYAKNVMPATLISRLHRLNILYDRKFDIEWSGNPHYALKLGYDSSHTTALDAVPSGARVMDIGCGPAASTACWWTRAAWSLVSTVPAADRSVFEDFVVWNEQVPLEIGPANTTTCCCSTSSST